MPTVTKTWLFPANNAADYNAFTKNTVTGLTWSNPATVADADTGGTAAGSGYVSANYAPGVKNTSTGAAYIEWSGTWENLGVPTGATVTHIQVTWRYKCQTYTTGAASTAGPFELRDSAGTTVTATTNTGVAYSATHATWQTSTGSTMALGTPQASNTSIRLRQNATQAVGNSTSAINLLLRDYFEVTVTYGYATDVRVSFPTPGSAPGTGAGLQAFRALVRKKVNDANDPLARIELWESGALKSTVASDTAVTSATSQIISGSWDASTLTTGSGANVEAKVVGTPVAGNSVEVGAIEWNKYPQDVAAGPSLLLPTDTVQRILMRR